MTTEHYTAVARRQILSAPYACGYRDGYRGVVIARPDDAAYLEGYSEGCKYSLDNSKSTV